MEAGGSLRRQSSLVADSLRGAPSHLVDPATGPNRGGQNWGNSVIESGEIPLILVTNPKVVQTRLGHSSIQVTFDRYGHLFPGWDEELNVRLEAVHRDAAPALVAAGPAL